MDDSARRKEEMLTAQRANMLGMQYFDTTKLTTPPLIKDILTLEELYQNKVFVLTKDDNSLVIGITSGTPQSYTQGLVKKFVDQRITFVVISEAGQKELMLQFDPPKEVTYQDVTITADSSSSTLKEVSETINQVLPGDLFDYLLKQAYKLSASDIHLENKRDGAVRIRFRVHGVLHDIATLSLEKYRQLMSTIASKANIAASAPIPQTGHISTNLDAEEINIRIETAPTLYGQDVVMRVFVIQKELLDIANLGLDDEELRTIDEIIEHPSGLVIAVGPTGSGKTTTLYSIINRLNHSNLKIITLEDPVEYSLEGLVQIPIQTMKAESFNDGLRTVLRMDPDVIMVGEIRDADTANTALQAALSGHLVLTTFHAADAAAALARLLTFTKNNPLFTSAVKLIIAQRLVRRLDDETKEAYVADEMMATSIREAVAPEILPDGPIKLFKAVPSAKSPFGYNGRTAVVELLTMNEEIERLVHKLKDEALADDLREAAQKSGMRTLVQSAVYKALDGVTSIEEVYRVL